MDFKTLKIGFADLEGTRLFNELCIKKIDTLFYDKKFLIVNSKAKYKYYEVILYQKYDSVITGEIHKIGHKMTKQISLATLNVKNSDIYATYFIHNNIKYYNFVFSSTFNTDNLDALDKYEEDFKNYFCSKYDFSKIQNKDKWIGLDIYINEKGKVIEGIIKENPFEIFDTETQSQIRSEIIESIKILPKLVPEKILDNNVSIRYGLILGLKK
jgi:hypothetical protein